MNIFAYSWISYLLSAFKKNNTESHWESLLKPPWGVFFLLFHVDNQKNKIDIWKTNNFFLFLTWTMDYKWICFLWLWIEKDTEFVALNVYFFKCLLEFAISAAYLCPCKDIILRNSLTNKLSLLSVRYNICLTAVWSGPYIKGCIRLVLLTQRCGSPPC